MKNKIMKKGAEPTAGVTIYRVLTEMTYKEFLESKIELATESGFDVNPNQVNKALKPHQKDAVMWALKGGKRALFESFGMGKTVQEIEFCKLAAENEVDEPTLFDFM